MLALWLALLACDPTHEEVACDETRAGDEPDGCWLELRECSDDQSREVLCVEAGARFDCDCTLGGEPDGTFLSDDLCLTVAAQDLDALHASANVGCGWKLIERVVTLPQG